MGIGKVTFSVTQMAAIYIQLYSVWSTENILVAPLPEMVPAVEELSYILWHLWRLQLTNSQGMTTIQGSPKSILLIS